MKSRANSSPKQSSPPPQPKKRRANDPARNNPSTEIVLPLAEETEREILGVIIIPGLGMSGAEILQRAVEAGLTANLFQIQSNRMIFSALTDMQSRGWEITLLTLQDYLNGQHKLKQIGGPAYLAEVSNGRAIPSMLAGLIRQLQDINYKREAVKKAAELQNLASNGASPAEIEEFLDTIPRTHTTVQKYTVTQSGIVYRKPARFGFGYENEPITNFIAKIVAEITEDDGSSEAQKIFELEITQKGQSQRVEVAASKFEAMSWVTLQIGAEASIYPGKKEHARFAIQAMSPAITKRTVYAHTGWRQIEKEWCYLHGGGAITPSGNRGDIFMRLPHDLRCFILPDPATGGDVIGAYRAVLALLDAFPRPLSVPLVGGVFGAILGMPDYSIYITGESGSFKSEATAIVQSFFGAGFNRLTMPANWTDTWGVLLTKAFIMKDALMIIDDFSPTGQKRYDDELHSKAEIVFRAAGNRSGKGGLRSDMTVRVSREPRGLLGSSGEDLPRNYSVQNRLLINLIKKGEITAANLSAMQKMATAGTFARSTSTFLIHVARNYEKIKSKFDEERIIFRDKLVAQLSGHSRQPTTAAHLAAAWRAWIRAAVEDKAISEVSAKKLWAEVWNTLKEAGHSQTEHQGTLHPVDHFLDLLRSALTSGKAHLQTVSGGEPSGIGPLCGWRNGMPSGECAGWVDSGKIYLQIDTAYGVANMQGLRNNQGLAVSQRTLCERLDDRKLIVMREGKRGYKCRTPSNRMPAVAIPLTAVFDVQTAIKAAESETTDH